MGPTNSKTCTKNGRDEEDDRGDELGTKRIMNT